MRLSTTFEKISREFNIKFDELSKEIKHNLSAGEAREEVLKKLLREYLPNRFSIDSGFVIDSNGGESKQIDIVIYDNSFGSIWEINGIKYFPCETVVAVGEVKSDIKKRKKLKDALKKIKSVKELDRSNKGNNNAIVGPGISGGWIKFNPEKEYRYQIFGFIFTSSGLKRETMIPTFQEFNKTINRNHWINLYCDYNNYILSYRDKENLIYDPTKAVGLYTTDDSEVNNLLLLFFTLLSENIYRIRLGTINHFSYSDIETTNAIDFDLFSFKDPR